MRTMLTALFLSALLATTASAHLRLTSHLSRYDDEQKSGPCGVAGGQRTTDRVYSAKPGTEVLLVWDEYINHPSHFRIQVDLEGHDDFVDPILDCAQPKDSIADCFQTGPDDVADLREGGVHNATYTLPSTPCDNCTLQVIQAMYDKPPFEVGGNDIYYQCIDLVLDPNGPDQLTLLSGGSGGGCSAVGGTGTDVMGAMVLLLGLALGARRNRSTADQLRRHRQKSG